jgi:hypothetical protein
LTHHGQVGENERVTLDYDPTVPYCAASCGRPAVRSETYGVSTGDQLGDEARAFLDVADGEPVEHAVLLCADCPVPEEALK